MGLICGIACWQPQVRRSVQLLYLPTFRSNLIPVELAFGKL